MSLDNNIHRISLPTWSIIKIALVIIGVLVLYLLRDIVGLVFVAVFFAAAITPLVDWLQRRKIPRPLAMIMIYAIMFLVISLIIGFLVPPISRQVNDIADKFPQYYHYVSEGFDKIKGSSDSINITNLIGEVSGKASSGLLSVLSSIFGGVVFFIVVLVIVFYMAVEEKAIEKIVESIVPDKHQADVTCLLYRIQDKLGQWLRNVLALGGIIAVLIFFILLPVMPRYALILALFAGLTEFIPYVGPFLGAIPAVFLALSIGSWFTVGYVIVAYTIVQQSENHFIVPRIMKRAVGLHPIVSIIAIMIGARLGQVLAIGPVVGVLLAIPVATTIFEIVDYFADKKKGRQECGIKS
jgi:predicted PurR-regulated permease PerM